MIYRKILKLTLALLFCIPFFCLAQENLGISAIGCYVRENSGASISVRMQSFDCELTLTNLETVDFSANVSIFNIDPDYFIVESEEVEIETLKDVNSFSFDVSLGALESVSYSIRPWNEEDSNFYFVAISDPQYQTTTFEELSQEILAVNPPLVVVAGDIIDGESEGDEE